MTRKVTEDFIGTCQACFGEFKVNEGSHQIVLHGYKRPGHGYIVGNCAGTDHAPFEYDTALTVQIIASHRSAADTSRAYKEKLETGKVTKLIRYWQDYDRQTFRTIEKQEEVEPGHKHWDSTLRGAIGRAEANITYHTRVANFLQSKVDAWTRGQIVGIDVPATGKTRTFRKAYDPAEEDAANARAAEKAKRDAKPGKLKLIFYQPSEPRDPNGYSGNDRAWREWLDRKDAKEKAYAADIRQWAKANIEGKTMVRPAIGDYDLPRDVRGNGDFDVVIVHLPWEYRDEITTMFSTARLYENQPKSISYVLCGGTEPR